MARVSIQEIVVPQPPKEVVIVLSEQEAKNLMVMLYSHEFGGRLYDMLRNQGLRERRDDVRKAAYVPVYRILD